MSKLVAFVVLLTISAATNAELRRNHHLKKSSGSGDVEKTNFDYLILRQIWPATTCMFPGPNTCSIAKNITTWVVHGLWFVCHYYHIGLLKSYIFLLIPNQTKGHRSSLKLVRLFATKRCRSTSTRSNGCCRRCFSIGPIYTPTRLSSRSGKIKLFISL